MTAASLELIITVAVLLQVMVVPLERSLFGSFPQGYPFFKICAILAIIVAVAVDARAYPSLDGTLLLPTAVLGSAALLTAGYKGAGMYFALCALEEFTARLLLLNFLASLPSSFPTGFAQQPYHVVIGGALFAAGHLYHGKRELTVGSGALAVVCGALFVWTQSLVLCTLAHFYLGTPFILGGIRDIASFEYHSSFWRVLKASS